MEERRRILKNGAELVLWEGRKMVYASMEKELQSRSILEQDDVARMESGITAFFSRKKRGYEEKLEKEKLEAAEAKAEFERVSTRLTEADKKIIWLRKTLEIQKEMADNTENMDKIKAEIFLLGLLLLLQITI